MAITELNQIIDFNIDSAPTELKEKNQWIYWKAEKNEKKGTWDKVPYKSPKVKASSTNSNTWKSFDDIIKGYNAENYSGIGFVLTNEDNLICLDIDNAINPETQEPTSELAKKMMENTWHEISPSGTGLHCYFIGTVPQEARKKNTELNIELYSHGRYITFTGRNTSNLPISDDQAKIDDLIEKYFSGKPINNTADTVNMHEVDTDNPFLEVEATEVMRNIAQSKNADKISKLMRGEWEGVYSSQSDADLALCNHLAFFTEKDINLMDFIFRQSGLYRQKWDENRGQHTYGHITLNKAIQGTSNKISNKQPQQQLDAVNEPMMEYIPYPYKIKASGLFKEIVKGSGNNVQILEEHISSNFPIITKKIKDVESHEVTYEMAFTDDRKTIKLPVNASQLRTRKELLDLARYGLDVSDVNVMDMLDFIQKSMMKNRLITVKGTQRIGFVDDALVMPYEDEQIDGIELFVTDPAYKTLIKGFETKGTLLDYKLNVFDEVKNEHVVMAMIYSSLASILLHEFDLEPFIVDTSSKTSTGKTTALKVASSVWGSDKLINTFNSTVVAHERKTTFLNAFPMYVDDTRGARVDDLAKIVYNHSFGSDKARGTINSVRVIQKHKNIMLTTGETSLADVSKDKGGIGARVITLEDTPFNFKGFGDLYQAINNYHGTLGKAFWKCYNHNKEYYQKQFTLISQKYFDKSDGNEVLERLARPFAILELAGTILSQMDGFEHDYQNHMNKVYSSMLRNNENIDKPKQLLSLVLEHLDSQRSGILYPGDRFVKNQTLAIYHEDFMGVTSATLTNLLGIEKNKMVREWKSRNYLECKADGRSQKQMKHNGSKYNVYAIRNNVINELGYDFSIDHIENDFDII